MNSAIESDIPPKIPFRWVPWGLGLIVVLMPLAIWRVISGHRPDNPLEGDADEASGALSAILLKTPADKQLPMLRKALNDSNPGLRYSAVDGLGSLKERAAAADIEGAFTDSASIVRQRALEVLPNADKERGFRLLLTALIDEDTWIQDAAINQIAAGVNAKPRWIDRRAVPFLMRALDSPSQTVSTLALRPLRDLTGQKWRLQRGMTDAQRRDVFAQWRTWWKQSKSSFPVAPEFDDIRPVRPARSDPAPEFSLTDLDGKAINNRTQKGKVTLVNFWATWCPPCRQEVPDLVKLDRMLREKGLDIVGLAVAETNNEKGVRNWCALHGAEYHQVLATADVQEAFGHIEEIPVSLMIDKKGQIRYRWDAERDLGTFQRAAERLLAEKP